MRAAPAATDDTSVEATRILGPQLQRASECEAVLRSLPMWFGIEDVLLMYAKDSATMPTFALEAACGMLGFVTLKKHYTESWEVHCIAVSATARGRGLGTRLLQHAENWVREQGALFLQIKTVAESSPSVEYAQTREFYRAMGYVPLEVFPALWSPRNPALQLIKALRGDQHGPSELQER